MKEKKLKIVRVVTASYVVEWHLHNTLIRSTNDFEMCVVGKNVSSYKDIYPNVLLVDIDLDRKINFFVDIGAFFKLCRFLYIYKPDIAHSIMPKAGLFLALAGYICRIPVRIHTFTGQVWSGKTIKFRFLFYWADRLINLLNAECLTDSPSQSVFLYDHGISTRGRPLSVLGKGSLSGVDVSSEYSDAGLIDFRKELGALPIDCIFIFLARKTRDKGAFDIIYAFSKLLKKHHNIKLLYCGPDESGGELDQLMVDEPDLFENVISSGKIDDHERYLAVSDVLCLPSYREGFGTIVIDAAALAVPAIGSNIVGLVDAIDDGVTGLLFPPGDIDKLVLAMELFLQDACLRKKMGTAAKERAKEFFSADKIYLHQKQFYFNHMKS